MTNQVVKILLVENDTSIVRALERSFRLAWRAICDSTDTAEGAIGAIEDSLVITAAGVECGYDAIVCDWALSGGHTGDVVLRYLASIGLAHKLVFLTSHDRQARAVHNAVASKPCAMPVLHELVSKAANLWPEGAS